jgi:hypothetical protein
VITAEIHSDKWTRAVQARAARFKIDVRDVMKDEARLYSVQMLRLTPPTNPTRLKGKDGKKLSDNVVGTNAARRDVLRSMTPADPDWPDSGLAKFFLRSPRLRRYVENGDIEKFSKVIKNLGKFAGWRVETFSSSLHLNARGSRGRVTSTKRVFIIGNAQISAFWKYMTETLAHVGRLKAGWLPAIEKLGGRVTSKWITRHRMGARGRCEAYLDGNHPRIVVVNGAMGVGQLHKLAQDTFRIRAVAITRRMKRTLQNLAGIGRGGSILMLENPNPKASALDQARDAVYSADS